MSNGEFLKKAKGADDMTHGNHRLMEVAGSCWPEILAVVKMADELMEIDPEIDLPLNEALDALDKKASEL